MTVRRRALLVLLPAAAFLWLGADSPEVRVTVHGAAGQVSGSLFVLEVGGRRWMVDAGLFYPEEGATREERRQRAEARSSRLPPRAAGVEGVLLTHAHLDHAGRLPLLVRSGYAGPIFATDATLRILEPMLRMQIRYEAGRRREWVWSDRDPHRSVITAHWHGECEWARRIRARNRRTFAGNLVELEDRVRRDGRERSVSPCRVCAGRGLEPVKALMRPVPLDSEVPLAEGVAAEPLDAGHIPGSVSWLVRVDREDGPLRILFSGDLGGPDSTLVEGPVPAPPVDAVFLETTYGCERRGTAAGEEFAAFRRDLSEVIAAGGTAWIPAFALDRTQKVLHQIRLAQREGLLPERDLPVAVLSSTAREISAVYTRLRGEGWFRDSWERDPANLRPPGYMERFDLDDPPGGPAILVTTSGMLDFAFSRRMLDRYLPRPEVMVFLVGHQDPLSPGGLLEEGSADRPAGTPWTLATGDGKTVTVRARVRRYGGFSAHAKADEQDLWLSRQDRQSTRVFLVHGEKSALRERRACLEEEGWRFVGIPRAGEAHAFGTAPVPGDSP